MKKSNINFLIVTRANYPSSSWGNRVRMIANGLKQNGVCVKVLVTYPWPSIESIESSEEYIEFLTEPCEKKESVFSIIKQIKTLFLLKKRLVNFKHFDRVLLTGDRWLDSNIVSNFCQKYNIEFIVEVVDEVGRKYDKDSFSIYKTLAIINREMFNSNLKKIGKLFVLSSYLESKYESYLSKNKIIRSSPTLINVSDYLFKLNTYNYFEENLINIQVNNILITYAGSCERPNGIFFFIKCLSYLVKNKQYNNLRVLLLFNIGDSVRVQNYVSEIGLGDKVRIILGVSPNYIPSIYNRSDILVLPEQGNIIANAGFPGKVGEYLISGKAIISTNFSDLSLYLKNGYNCMISEIGDINTYIQNLELLITDKEKRKELGKNAHETGLKFFSNKEVVKIYIE